MDSYLITSSKLWWNQQKCTKWVSSEILVNATGIGSVFYHIQETPRVNHWTPEPHATDAAPSSKTTWCDSDTLNWHTSDLWASGSCHYSASFASMCEISQRGLCSAASFPLQPLSSILHPSRFLSLPFSNDSYTVADPAEFTRLSHMFLTVRPWWSAAYPRS